MRNRSAPRTFTLLVCVGVLIASLLVSAAAPAASVSSRRHSHSPSTHRLTPLEQALQNYDPGTQSHPGACSQTTLNVAHAVHDLSLNGVLGEYAARVGVHATRRALITAMDHALMVIHLPRRVVAANHGCTTDGVIFPWGKRTLYRGETVGVALSAKVRAALCRTSHAGCVRETITVHTVFPTNCWNVDAATVSFVVYVHKHKHHTTPPPPKKAIPSATATVGCSTITNGGGTLALQLTDGARATAPATFTVTATGTTPAGYGPQTLGPIAPGTTSTVLIPVDATGAPVTVTIVSGGKQLLQQSFKGCPAEEE